MTNMQFYGGYVQQATYWQLSGVDGYGKRVFSNPILIDVHWSDRTDLVIKKDQEETPSKATVFVQQDMQVGEYLALGDFTATGNLTSDPLAIPEQAFQILQYMKNISMMGDAHFRSVVL